MTWEVLAVFGLLVLAIALFAWERVGFDVTAFIILSILLVTGILTPREGIAGFSNAAVITIGALFVVSDGLRRTGALNRLGDVFARVGQRSYMLALVVMMLTIGTVSAFINNTAAVAIFIPIVLGVAADLEVSPSKLLMPLSFASMFGGVCTLIGTSTNIIVSSIAEQNGLAPFAVFEMTPLGLVFFVTGFAYLLLVGIRLIPERRGNDELAAQYEMNDYLTEVVLEPGSKYVGLHIDDAALTEDLDLDLDVLQVIRGGEAISPFSRLEENDVLRIYGPANEIDRLLDREDFTLRPTEEWFDVDLSTGQRALVEAVVAPESGIEGRMIRDVGLHERFGAVVLALRHHSQLQQEELGRVRLSGGDALLLSMPQERVQEISRDPLFLLASEVPLLRFRTRRLPLAVAVLVAVVSLAAFDVMPIVATATIGALVMVVTGCIRPEEAYEAINWKVIFLLAGILPLGTAMQKTGAAELMAHGMLNVLGDFGPHAVLGGFFLLTMALTAVVTNNATAVVMAPIAIQAASSLGVEARPLLMGVTFAASLSFVTPIGYQTNTMVYGPGRYHFTDFTWIGGPLNLLYLMLAMLLIPLIWPF